TMLFTALVVMVKTRSYLKAILAFCTSYGFVFVYASLLPYVARQLAEYFFVYEVSLSFLGVENPVAHQNVQIGYPSMFFTTLLQLFICVLLYFFLNPILIRKLPV